MNALFSAVDELVEAEIRYYHRRRRTRAWISGITRLAAWLLGTVGLLIPLLAGIALQEMSSRLGYVFLAASASCLAANSLFGGTEGHIRFVSTQLELERILVASRIKWCQYLAAPGSDAEQRASGFAQILDYASAVHAVTLSETARWGETLTLELAKYLQSIESSVSSGKKGPQKS